jgi:hypothetical protein
MKPISPTPTLDQHTQNTNVVKILTGNVSPGNGLTFDPTGQPVTFSTDNQSGLLVRIGSHANPYGVPASWGASNSDLTIAHNLNKVPYGFYVVSKNKTCDVFLGTMPPTLMNITLQCTDATADVTVFIMV